MDAKRLKDSLTLAQRYVDMIPYLPRLLPLSNFYLQKKETSSHPNILPPNLLLPTRARAQ